MPYFVNVSSANIYRQATFHSEMDSQAVLWEQVTPKQHKNDFTEVITEDGYRGWINRRQLVQADAGHRAHLKMVTQPFSYIYAKPESSSAVLRDVTAGGYLSVSAQTGNWLKVILPDGVEGWVEARVFKTPPLSLPAALLDYACKFLGVPYLWGGKTSKGLDCSGFVQMVHKIFAIQIRRDAYMQFEDAHSVSSDPLQGKPGDLLFFAENGQRITHVGFALGQGKLLHARGMVRVNSLKKTDSDFDPELLNDFVEIRTFLGDFSGGI